MSDLSALSDEELMQQIQQHLSARPSAAQQIANDSITRGAKENASWIPNGLKPFLDRIGQHGIAGGPMGMMAGAAIGEASDLYNRAAYNAGGAVTDTASRYMPSPAAAGLGYATNLGLQSLPVFAGTAIGSQAAPTMRAGAERLMRNALKPNTASVERGQAQRAINTLLNEGVNVTPGGMQKLQVGIDSANNQVQNLLSQSRATMPKGSASNAITDAIAKMERYNPTPNADRAAMEAVQNEYLSNPLIPTNIPLTQANTYKQGIHKLLQDKYGELGNATTEANKALARGLREGIEAAEPAVGPANVRASALINALNQATRRVAVSGNKDPAGLALIANNPAAMAAFMAQRSELIKSLLARGMNAGQRVIPDMAGGLAGAYAGLRSGQSE